MLPLEALLLFPLLADLRELSFVIFPCPALLSFASGIVLHALHLLLPSFHELVVALADLLFLRVKEQTTGSGLAVTQYPHQTDLSALQLSRNSTAKIVTAALN